MSREILDDSIKYPGPRTCPECGFQFPFGEFVRRYMMAIGLSKWSCQGCRKLIKCDFIKIQILSLVGLTISGVLFGILLPYFNSVLLGIFSLILSCAFVSLAFYYTKFEMVK